jgi:3-oxoacid CoA-transferase
MRTVPQISAADAARLVSTGDRLMAGGFGMTGAPVNLLHALAESGVRDLTFIGNNVGEAGLGGGRLLRNGQIATAIGSYFTSNPEVVAAAQSGRITVQLLPQGSLAEAIRAGGAGLGGFYTPVGADTEITRGQEVRLIDGVPHVFVAPIRAHVAFVRARVADTAGNLVYRMTEQNFNKAMATAADIVVAEVDEIVPAGTLEPESIHTPGCFVDYLVQARVLPEHLGTSLSVKGTQRRADPRRDAMVRRARMELQRGDIVNLGIGIPTLVADLITEDDGILLHTENGMLGVGPSPAEGGAFDYPVNAGKVPVTALPGTSYFDSADSFAMIRGGHIDVAIMGGLQVDEAANLANWSVPGKPLLGVGGAMDLAQGAARLIVMMMHTESDGTPKLVSQCTLPLTARRVVDLLITDRAVFGFPNGRLTLLELMPGETLDTVRATTEAKFEVR